MNRCLSHPNAAGKFPLLTYAVTSKWEPESCKEDGASVGDVISQINESLFSGRSTVILDLLMDILDEDRDGLIGVEDIRRMKKELGRVVEPRTMEQMVERVSESGTHITRQ
jgi:Ca2+-binding EF-hand superfamily protein